MSDSERVLDDSIPEVREQLLRCCFGCEYAKDVGMENEASCAGTCTYAEAAERDYRKNCGQCETCRPVTMSDMRMVLCSICGNKRCPHAANHGNACTGSNESGQPGSSYSAKGKHE